LKNIEIILVIHSLVNLVSNVSNLWYMFYKSKFNKDIRTWNIHKCQSKLV